MPEENAQRQTEQIVFVNGEPAKCGCHIRFSDGGGQYSNVHYLTPCATHSGVKDVKPFGPVDVARDKDGWWFHPYIPDFDGGEDPALYMAWVAEQGLELKGWHSGDELDSHVHEFGDASCNGWNPMSPGPEWFLMGIFDTEDDPYVQWARRVMTP